VSGSRTTPDADRTGLFLYQPLQLRAEGRLAVTDDADRHLRDKVMAILFTAPGERVNNPRFGVGLNRMVFEPLDELVLAAAEFRVSEGLRRDLGDEALIEDVTFEARPEEGVLLLAITLRRKAERQARRIEVLL
jgi:phage baseplate assembly protein W